ncbi:cobyrinate a,c-diamide synthase [uncultured Tessaracoccus sp.]|uniref:cobyrinate a,c-diamide synthase n=1 Tax=uncultured Tessaracoccus sp. TaxID=905023 RepID=UPI0025FDBE44|nr:cobyrinate a,c-diamide synthase [uncultured Tessaracoccus sp.]
MVTPRIVVAAPASGSGKTTVATGLMAALTARGLAVAPAKVGPDYIDPGYHTLATGRPGRNLDPFLTSEALVPQLFLHGARDADVAVVEGVMGLFDGRLGTDSFASTAHVARLLDAPVLLVVDVRHVSRTAAAVVQGLAGFDERVRVAGVVLNHVGSDRHAREVREAIDAQGIPVVGALPRNLDVEAPSRHLGLVPAAERDDAGVVAMGELVRRHLDLDQVLAIAATAGPLDAPPWDPTTVVRPPSDARPRVAVAGGRAFTFRYPETDELLAAGGCEVVEFDPMTDATLPDDVAGLWLGGGFPEVHADALGGNASLRAAVRAAVEAGVPTVAECAGLIYLSESIDGHEMVGAIPGASAMHDRLRMGYREAEAPADSLLTRRGERVRGHEFHRTRLDAGSPAWLLDGRPDGHATATLHASYLHTHWAGAPQLAQRFVDAVHARAARTEPDLWHHGDRQLAPGLVDLAVNVRQPETPDWLAAAVREPSLAAYPDAGAATRAIARYHRVHPTQVLPLAGAAEGFTLLARAVPGDVVVVHPQFTEPETAMLAAGRTPRRHLLRRDEGFHLVPERVPRADVTVVGNPTNPTGVLHEAAELRRIEAGLLVVDEAFLDAVPGEPETLIGKHMEGLLVLRSLTKTWALAGLRAGYAVGDPRAIRALAEQQPTWSVSTPALAAIEACCSRRARDEALALAEEAVRHRADLVARLGALGLPTIDGRAPFVLVDTSSLGPGSLVEPLAERGFAVRRGDTFPGLGPTWLRLAVRTPSVHEQLVQQLRDLKENHGSCTAPR